MLSPDQLNPTDESVLDMLKDGRVTAPYVSEAQDRSLEYVRARLKRLVEHGHVRRVHDGLYECVDDPRDNNDTEQEN